MIFPIQGHEDSGKGSFCYLMCLLFQFQVRAQGCSEAKAKTQMKVHLQQHIKDILNCGDHELFSAEPVAAKLRRLARVKLEWPEHHFLVPKIER